MVGRTILWLGFTISKGDFHASCNLAKAEQDNRRVFVLDCRRLGGRVLHVHRG